MLMLIQITKTTSKGMMGFDENQILTKTKNTSQREGKVVASVTSSEREYGSFLPWTEILSPPIHSTSLTSRNSAILTRLALAFFNTTDEEGTVSKRCTQLSLTWNFK